ncbi:YeiH family protein [Nocardioides sp. SYSU D00038]|uniref:YeiH family protein n=1 Tax=Nocardioides sp. SYSU D00038 TaxID=2812554 RepID=UPI00196881DE|nr:putative sulfate exporter family transporter [Nocardioides sp. SYSU D00038]
MDPRLPGLAVAAVGAAVALGVHAMVPALGATLVAIVVGLALGAGRRLGPVHQPGLAVATRTLLRAGVALLGLQLVLPDLLALGWPVLAVAAGVVVAGIGGTLLLANGLGVPADQALLVACGFSICGAAAVAAVDGVRRARRESVATAVSLVVVLGSATMLLLPAAATALGLRPEAAGAWSGASVQEVGQVVVAGGLVGGAALQVAVVVKLARVLMLAPVLAVLSVRARRETVPGERPPVVPGFVLAFAGCVLAASALPLPGWLLAAAGGVQAAALTTAMVAIGAALDPAVLRRTSPRVVGLALGATVLVAGLGLPAAYLV